MKTIGLIGGLSWESTSIYYKIINQEVNRRKGDKHSARIQMYSFDFDEIDRFLQDGDFKSIENRLVEEARKLESSGAELLVLCANTAHKWAKEVQHSIHIPLIHIGDSVGKEISRKKPGKVLLLGTKYTMEEVFIKSKLETDYHVDVVTPSKTDRTVINDIIYDELILGHFLESSKNSILDIINDLKNIEGVILGCTELPLIIKPQDCKIPLYDTTEIHACDIVDASLN